MSNDVKVICFHLPQFHQIPENDLWWGEGFTEWTNTKRARPLFVSHRQPREPFRNNYYCLLDPTTRRWQAETARAYGVHGFCYYHYWFNGKRLLEKPVQEIQLLGEPDFPFCLAWANEPWTRRWDGKDADILMPQTYGGSTEWESHFYELLAAFKDTRYIKIDGKPLFLIYRPACIPQCDTMLKLWKQLALREGLPGLYIAELITGYQQSTWIEFDAHVHFEPFATLSRRPHSLIKRIANFMRVVAKRGRVLGEYEQVWEAILAKRPSSKTEIPGAFVDWDNTPRKGYKGSIVVGSSPRLFGHYMSMQLRRSKELYGSKYIFINAWNEWAEGNYLEPDKENGYSYLQALREAIRVVREGG